MGSLFTLLLVHKWYLTVTVNTQFCVGCKKKDRQVERATDYQYENEHGKLYYTVHVRQKSHSQLESGRRWRALNNHNLQADQVHAVFESHWRESCQLVAIEVP